MKFRLIVALLLPLSYQEMVYGQKPLINDSSYKEWTSVVNGLISNNGRYICYSLKNKPAGYETLVISSVDKKWKKEFPGYVNANFSADSKHLFASMQDTVIHVVLNTDVVFKMPNCSDQRLLKSGKLEWLAYQQKGSADQLILRSLQTTAMLSLGKVKQFETCPDGIHLILKRSGSGKNTDTLYSFNMTTQVMKVVYSGNEVNNIIFDLAGKKMAFTLNNPDESISIWTADTNGDNCTHIFSDDSDGILPGHRICVNSTWRFNKDGSVLFFTQVKKDLTPTSETGPLVWNYKDRYLRSRYKWLKTVDSESRNLSVLDISTRHLKLLLTGVQKISESEPGKNGNIFLIEEIYGDRMEADWNTAARSKHAICDYTTGQIIPMTDSVNYPIKKTVSPDGKYVVYYDNKRLKYGIYAVDRKAFRYVELPDKSQPHVFLGWTVSGKWLLIQFQNVLWAMNPANIETSHILADGRETNTIFRIAQSYPDRLFPDNANIFLKGFQQKTQTASLHLINIGTGRFKTLVDHDAAIGNPLLDAPGQCFAKAENANFWLVKFELNNQTPNYMVTQDFKKFTALSTESPEGKYNWLTTELVTYKANDNSSYQAVVYKPENFDPAKKYPVIFIYYRELEYETISHIAPEPINAMINIPIMVSNGYIVVRPEIRVSNADPGQSALTCVNAAADYLGQFGYIDTLHMGITGHSLGGFETNYIVTHSVRFAAALSAAGASNMVEQGNELRTAVGTGFSKHSYNQTIGFRAGLDSVPNDYIRNSPILFAKNIKTPLLLVHNDEDGNVDVRHSLQFFVQLRSLKKPVWLVQYPGERHIVFRNEKFSLDLQHKSKTFFDHYLKGKELPDWMEEPI
jgi:dipeptidyl aminopeptidase/acylaminoacyl peptidase